MAEKYSLKDDLFNAETVGRLAQHFGDAGVFDPAAFSADVMADMLPLELKERMHLIADVLERYLPTDFPDAATAIKAALPPPLDPTRTDDDFGHFIYAPLGIFVERQGLTQHFDLSLDLMHALTQRFSMEFSIRAFLNHDADAVLSRMQAWAQDDHYHVRRLVSEGTRPRLPWGQNVGLTPDQTLPLLDMLHADPTRYVTRSVANHLNDLTKDSADAVLARFQSWEKGRQQDPKELGWMQRHALRNLIKSGHAGAMQQLGYRTDLNMRAEIAITPDNLAIGDKAEITAEITSDTDAPMLIDYVIDFVKANGKTAPKVFKFKVVQGKANVSLSLRKAHHFKKGATTFTHYPGAHRISLQVNGRIVAGQDFTLS